MEESKKLMDASTTSIVSTFKDNFVFCIEKGESSILCTSQTYLDKTLSHSIADSHNSSEPSSNVSVSPPSSSKKIIKHHESVKIPPNVRLPQRKGGMHLWQFLYAMLLKPNEYSHLIEWTINKVHFEFRLLKPESIAAWWGYHKNKKSMSYDKLSRSLRYYYDKFIIRKMSGERYVYRFCVDPELMYNALGNSENRPQLKPMPKSIHLMHKLTVNTAEKPGQTHHNTLQFMMEETDHLAMQQQQQSSPEIISFASGHYYTSLPTTLSEQNLHCDEQSLFYSSCNDFYYPTPVDHHSMELSSVTTYPTAMTHSIIPMPTEQAIYSSPFNQSYLFAEEGYNPYIFAPVPPYSSTHLQYPHTMNSHQ